MSRCIKVKRTADKYYPIKDLLLLYGHACVKKRASPSGIVITAGFRGQSFPVDES